METINEQEYLPIELYNINDNYINKHIKLQSRIHSIHSRGSICFVILRDRTRTIQCCSLKRNIGAASFKELIELKTETVIEIYGTLSKLPDNIPEIKATYYSKFEIQVNNYKIVSKPSVLPFMLVDANYMDYEKPATRSNPNVLAPQRQQHRYFELRAPVNNCIFKLRSSIVQYFRKNLLKNNFIEINSPKLVGTASESGSSVFELDYFNTKAYLAQSPQLYKQMCINADFNRVFEIGPVFRAENCVSHRHLCEFTGMDIEMTIPIGENYEYVIKTIWNTLCFIFDQLKNKNTEELNFIKQYHKFNDLVYGTEPLIIDFKDGVKMLGEIGCHQGDDEDLSSSNEKKLGEIVKEIHGVDIFVLKGYPTNARPFYTMKSEDENYTNSFDIIMRGEEICSGAQRINDYNMLIDNINNTDTSGKLLESLKDYVESFAYGSKPHGGCGIGLERVLMLYLELGNVRKVSLFPRDSNRITP